MSKNISFIILGIFLLIIGIISFMLMFIFSATQNSDYDYLFLVCIAIIVSGVFTLRKASKIKSEE